MSASGPVSNDPAGQEPLEELFGTVFDLAGAIASRIAADKVEMRLRHTLRKAGGRREEVSARPTTRSADEMANYSPPVTARVTRVAEVGRSEQSDRAVVALVTRAAGGDQDAWYELVDRYVPLVYQICTRYRLSNYDIEDVGQNVWLLLVEQLGKLREPAALPGWLATTTARECLRVVTAASKAERLSAGLDDSVVFVDDAVIDEEILVAERNAAVRAAFAELPPRCQRLLSMLVSDPPYSYAEIHAELGIPVGSIGPQRARCLERMRRSSALSAFVEGEEKIDIWGGQSGA